MKKGIARKSQKPTDTIPKGWSRDEFAGVVIGDKRLEDRLCTIAEDLALVPQAPINQACDDWSDTKAAYRFFDNEKVSPDKIIEPHTKRTRERVSSHELVLCIQDTCLISYTLPSQHNLGHVGINQSSRTPGMLLHTAFAVTPRGLPLGTLHQEIWSRDPENETIKYDRQNRPIEDKESYKWIKALKNARGEINKATEIVHVCDRESDIFDFFALADELNEKYLIRAAHNRFVDGDGNNVKVWYHMKAQDICGYVDVQVPKSKKRNNRTARLSVRFKSIRLKAPKFPKDERHQPEKFYKAYAVYAEEVAPPKGEEPIKWKLLTNLPVETLEDAVEKIAWYRRRWDIEEFHKVLKSGCKIEECRLQTASRLANFISINTVIAWRIFWITKINRTDPKAKCTAILSESEWKALYMKIHRVKLTDVPEKIPRVREAVRWIGQLGGFLGRKSDKEPGIVAIWRGWQRLNDFSEAIALMQ